MVNTQLWWFWDVNQISPHLLEFTGLGFFEIARFLFSSLQGLCVHRTIQFMNVGFLHHFEYGYFSSV